MASVVPFDFPQHFPERQGRTRDELELELQRLERQADEAFEAGRAAGHAEALAQLQAERDTALLAASTALGEALRHLDGRFGELEQQVARLGAELALDLADHLAARALERDSVLAIDQAIGRALSQVRRGQPLQIRVAPALVDAVERCLSERQQADRRKLFATVVADPEIAPADVRVAWENGALLLDYQARRQAMAEEIAAMLAA